MNGTICGRENELWEGRFTGICSKRIEVKLSSGAAVEIGFVQVGSVTVDLEAYVTVVKKYGIIRVRGTLIDNMGDGLSFLLSVGVRCKGA